MLKDNVPDFRLEKYQNAENAITQNDAGKFISAWETADPDLRQEIAKLSLIVKDPDTEGRLFDYFDEFAKNHEEGEIVESGVVDALGGLGAASLEVDQQSAQALIMVHDTIKSFREVVTEQLVMKTYRAMNLEGRAEWANVLFDKLLEYLGSDSKGDRLLILENVGYLGKSLKQEAKVDEILTGIVNDANSGNDLEVLIGAIDGFLALSDSLNEKGIGYLKKKCELFDILNQGKMAKMDFVQQLGRAPRGIPEFEKLLEKLNHDEDADVVDEVRIILNK